MADALSIVDADGVREALSRLRRNADDTNWCVFEPRFHLSFFLVLSWAVF
jgi:hypothetical protein